MRTYIFTSCSKCLWIFKFGIDRFWQIFNHVFSSLILFTFLIKTIFFSKGPLLLGCVHIKLGICGDKVRRVHRGQGGLDIFFSFLGKIRKGPGKPLHISCCIVSFAILNWTLRKHIIQRDLDILAAPNIKDNIARLFVRFLVYFFFLVLFL